MAAKQKAIIIGAGVAGLACAIRLAVQGFEVTIFEKNNYAGGKIGLLEKDGYCFDTGPSLFVQPQNIRELFDMAGETIIPYFHYKKLDLTCKYFYEDGTIINAYSNKEKFAKELKEKTGGRPHYLFTYLDEAEKIYNKIGSIFLNQSLHKKEKFDIQKILKAFSVTKPAYLFSTLHKQNKRSFSDEHVVQLFDRFATYNGSNPYKAPGMLKLISHVEMNEGVYYPEGGMISIARALYGLAIKKGVSFHFNHTVQKIIVADKKATGIVVNNETFFADVAVSNIDVYFTYLQLLNDEQSANTILKQERSSSALVFYWGIKKDFPGLELHNIFFSKNYKAEFNSIFEDKKIYDDPTIYINITSKMEPEHAPSGKENWFVMINVASNEQASDEATINLCRKNILAKLNRILKTDIEPLIETEAVLHPKLIEAQTASYAGALYGTSSNSRKAAFMRHPNFSNKIQRLYFAGGSVHPGGGIPLCLKSAKIASELIMEDSKKWKHE
ncbi:MAG: phytoene desaturase [Parafilimonas sp.]|nr:phytoene desaturase [Parafilimonas sp.]